MIPNPTNFPTELDTDENLFLVHDSLRVRLVNDYNPGDVSITVEGDSDTLSIFPPTGIITLTEQCSDIDKRAISFFYGSRTQSADARTGTFDQLEVLPEFEDVVKLKKITNVTMNVLDKHHNHLKDALIAVETFLGIQGQTDTIPFGTTITGRMNFLKKLVLSPKAWFTVDKRIGLTPLCVEFKQESFRTDTDDVVYIWDFGDDTSYNVSYISGISTITPDNGVISATDQVPDGSTNVIVRDLDGGAIKKCYDNAGLYDVKLTVRNQYGEDTIEFKELINAKIPAPEYAAIEITPNAGQSFTAGIPAGGPYTTPPKIRTSISEFVLMEVPEGENPNTPGYSFGGELLDSNSNPIDPIINWTWSLGDDLSHLNLNSTKALYSVGGYYNLTLRVDTQFGTYRITSYKDSIDIVETRNLWLYNYQTKNSDDSGVIEAWEFGILGETFKKLGNQTFALDRDNRFLKEYSKSAYYTGTEDRAKKEFFRNFNIAQQGSTPSGDKGNSLLFWAKGADDSSFNASDPPTYPSGASQISTKKYNGFSDTYTTTSNINPSTVPPAFPEWNWAPLISADSIYFILGVYGDGASTTPYDAMSDSIVKYDLQVESFGIEPNNSFSNGANEVLSMVENIQDDGGGTLYPTNGWFATYRTAWKDQTGYLLRNSGINEFFRISNFYRTEGTVTNQFTSLSKLSDMTGSSKVEGELVNLSNGVFFFNNSGEISAWNDITQTWEVGRSNSTTVSFRNLQDSNVSGFDNRANTLIAASDGDKNAYLSYDYSKNAFIKFNGTDLTFSSIGSRPMENQLKMTVY